MNISFYLTRPTANIETSIYARLCYSGLKLKWFTPEKICPSYWNKDNQRAKQTGKFKEYPEFNARLNNIESYINNIYRRYLNDHGGKIPTPEILKDLFDTEIKKREPLAEKERSFFGFFEELINQSKKGVRLHPKTGKPISNNTVKTYVTTFKHLSEFQLNYGREINFNSIDLDFYNDYVEYLMTGKKLHPKTGHLISLNLSSNTIGKHIQIIKLVLNEGTERGLYTNKSFKSKRFVTIREDSDSIYLCEKEVQELECLDISNNARLEKVRDLFLIGCRTGLRYSDYSILKADQIKDGFIETIQTKTNAPVVIPIHNTVKKIIEKYNGVLPKSISNQKTNAYLKELGKMLPSLTVTTSKTFTKGGIRIVKNYKKWELLCTHTARRSFATNEFLAEDYPTPTITIMAITGHKTEKAFLRYIRVTPSGHAKLLQRNWTNRNKLRVAG